jgi:hypothetical protein
MKPLKHRAAAVSPFSYQTFNYSAFYQNYFLPEKAA